jgi:hypothetical protein
MCGSYIHIDIEIDNEGRFETKLYYKGDDFSYPIMNFQQDEWDECDQHNYQA